MITNKQLREGKMEDILAQGIYTDPVFGVEIIWLAIRGYAPDWAIYYVVNGKDVTKKSMKYIRREGKKLKIGSSISKLVSCEKGVMKYYRF